MLKVLSSDVKKKVNELSIVVGWLTLLIAYILWIIYVDKPHRGTSTLVNVISIVMLLALSIATAWLFNVVFSVTIC